MSYMLGTQITYKMLVLVMVNLMMVGADKPVDNYTLLNNRICMEERREI